MYSKGKIITVSLVAALVLGIGIVKEGVFGKDKLEKASNIQSVAVSAETTTTTEPKGCPGGHRGKKGFESTLKELQDSGVLTESDVKKIEEYQKTQMEARKAQMKEKRNEEINNMVKENIITKEKAQKLIEALDKKMESIENKQ